MDISDYLKLGKQCFHKQQGSVFGKRLQTDIKSQKLKDDRRGIRDKLISKRRLIGDNLSPYKTPMVPGRNNKKVIKQDPRVIERLEKLRQWKEQKAKKIQEEKAKTKPLFKVTHIESQLGMPNLESVNKVIKGKPIKGQPDVKRKTPGYEFAPKNYKFQGPSNIKVMNLLGMPNNNSHYDLRSRKVVVEKKDDKIVKQAKQNSVSKLKKKTRKSNHKTYPDVGLVLWQRQQNIQSSSELSEEYPIMQNADTPQSNSPSSTIQEDPKQPKTPDSKNVPVTYISPFVTICRGKNSARKEFHHRKSTGGQFNSSPDMQNSTGPKAGSAYFHKILDGEISRIQSLCDEWNLYKKEQDPPEEACDMINVTIGQSQLLLEKKFKQFRNLIHSCDSGNSDMPITCEDLHGYWDTVYIQVNNLNKRFDNLLRQRSNNWEEVIPEKKTVVVKKATKPTVNTQASSGLRDAIKAARNKAKARLRTEESAAATNNFDGGFFSVQSPEKLKNLADLQSPNRSAIKKRKSLLMDVLTNESMKRESSSGLIMWKTAQAAKSIEKEPINTPGRSILKVRRSRSSVKKRTKAVLFMEEKYREVPVGELISLTPEENTSRMCLRRRLTKTKLF